MERFARLVAAYFIMNDSWGNLSKATQAQSNLVWRSDSLPAMQNKLVVGNRRSYGDVCVNDGGTIFDATGLNKFISFDKATGVVRCEAGVTLWQLAKIAVPHGWFLPVTPGTGFVTIAGAVANDVHGKNHHVAGSFGCYVKRFELRRSNGEVLICSETEHTDFFAATIGGLGLTGFIAWVEIALKPLHHSLMAVESVSYSSYKEFLTLSAESEKTHEYCVSWIDCLSDAGQGVFFRANHAQEGGLGNNFNTSKRRVPAFVGAGFPLVNRLSVKLFNAAYIRAHSGDKQYTETIAKFFYPLDSVLNWNRIYGRKGFYQFQCVVPFESAEVLSEMLARIAASNQGSFLSVLKTMGSIKSPALLSFCRPGVTLALDFPNRGDKTKQLIATLEKITVAAGGAIYPAKDAMMSSETFEKSFPKLTEFVKFIDPEFSSSFWRRVRA